MLCEIDFFFKRDNRNVAAMIIRRCEIHRQAKRGCKPHIVH